MRVNNQEISKLLKKYRNENDFTYEKLASQIDVSSRTCKSIEKDFVNVSLDTLIKICTVLKKDINTFIIYDETDGIKISELSGLKITDGMQYMIDRFETLAQEKGKIENELERYKAYFGDLPENNIAAEPSPKIEKK